MSEFGSFYDRKFGLLLEYQTDRQVLVSKLPQTNPQYIRCRRAALENVRLELFKDTAYSNISVCDVYKIENGILLQQFQQLVKDTPGGKIKGLFCSVPSDSVDHMIVYGMHKSNTVPKETMFPQLWISYPCENQTIQPLVDLDEYQKRLEASKPVPVRNIDPHYNIIQHENSFHVRFRDTAPSVKIKTIRNNNCTTWRSVGSWWAKSKSQNSRSTSFLRTNRMIQCISPKTYVSVEWGVQYNKPYRMNICYVILKMFCRNSLYSINMSVQLHGKVATPQNRSWRVIYQLKMSEQSIRCRRRS